MPTFHLPADWEAEKRELTARLDALESALHEALPLMREADAIRTGIGGNNPPEPIDEEGERLGTASDVVVAFRTIGDLRAQFALPEPDDHPLTIIAAWALKNSVRAVIATLKWLGERANEAASSAVKAAGAAIGAGTIAAVAAGPNEVSALVRHLSQNLHQLVPEILKLF